MNHIQQEQLRKGEFRFIDLFCGIGGFHQAMEAFGGVCVFASDIDVACNKVYQQNYNITSDYDITSVDETKIPKHDVLCGGFPCQAFSKAGKQTGINDTRGTLFFDILRILQYHKTHYIFLENVRNLVSHDNGNTWKVIQQSLKTLGYRLTETPIVFSPHQIGIPQFRERVYILGVYDPLNVDNPIDLHFNDLFSKDNNSIYSILDKNIKDPKYSISTYEEMILTAWDEFHQGIDIKTIGFPIWYDFFHCQDISQYPQWKQEFIRKNMELYTRNKKFIQQWERKYSYLKDFAPTHRKFEWQCGDSLQSLWEGVIQLRPSGIRVKKPNIFPALVAIVQIPIIGKYKRRLTINECAKLQSFPADFIPSETQQQAYKQFGNSVNIDVLKHVFRTFIENEHIQFKSTTIHYNQLDNQLAILRNTLFDNATNYNTSDIKISGH
ncbi:MAG: DNA cytosine methyltransferase [Alistipes sp.]